jgi:hypothetical protein
LGYQSNLLYSGEKMVLSDIVIVRVVWKIGKDNISVASGRDSASNLAAAMLKYNNVERVELSDWLDDPISTIKKETAAV